METLADRQSKRKIQIGVFIALFSVCVTLLGYSYYVHFKRFIQASRHHEISAVGRIKADQVANWYKDELDDLLLVSREAHAIQHLRNWFFNRSESEKVDLLEYFSSLRDQHELKEVLLLSPGGEVLLSTSGGSVPVDSVLVETALQSVGNPAPLSTDLYCAPPCDSVLIDFVTPLYFQDEPAALLVFRVDPYTELFPELEQWPTQTFSAEILLLRAEEDSLLILNSLQDSSVGLLQRKIPVHEDIVSGTGQPGMQGNVFSEMDYRGVPVYSYYTFISHTPWILVSKIDRSEVYAGLYYQGWFIGVSVLLLCLSFGLMLILINTSRQKRIYHDLYVSDNERRKLSGVVQQMADMVFITNREGLIEYVNPAFEKQTGYFLEEVVGKSPRFLKSGHHSDEFYAHFQKVIDSGEVFRDVFINRKKSGELFYEDKTVSPVFNREGKITHLVSTGKDITHQVMMEKDLLAAKERAEESDRLKTSFLKNISHEVRTPLNGIMGFSDLLMDPDSTDDQRLSYVKVIQKSSHQLLSVISNIIQIATIDAGQEKYLEERCDLEVIMKDLRQRFLPEAGQKGLSLKFEISLDSGQAEIFTDTSKLYQSLLNLLDNAVKFTDVGEVVLSVSLEGGFLYFCVKDTGPGIPDEDQSLIFEKFRQLEIEDNRHFGGNGLGLSIAKAYAGIMGGSIQVISSPGAGSSFVFKIPYKPFKEKDINQTMVETAKVQPERPSSKTLLVAEDQENNFLLVSEILKPYGYHLIHVTDGSEAVEVGLRDPSIDLVLMDLKMPVMDGYEATLQIKKARPDLPVIAITAFALRGDREKAMQVGCDDYLTKPFKKKELLELLGRYI